MSERPWTGAWSHWRSGSSGSYCCRPSERSSSTRSGGRLSGDPMDPDLDMKNRIRVLRAEKGWSQAELAEKVGISRNSINAVENDKFDPSLPLAFRIAELFELKIEDVFLREE